jgi:ABC-type glycerol-3-phosphate transport system substrate-binding protein
MEPTWGDLPTLAQNRAHSAVQGRVGATIIPGTSESFNPLTSQWEKSMLNTVGNTNGGSWHCVISRLSKQKEAAYDFPAFMANKKNAFFNVTNGWTGVQPSMKYEYFAPVGTGRVEEWENQGWDKDDAIVYLNAYYANLIRRSKSICEFPEPQSAGTNSMYASPPSCQAQERQKRLSTISIKPGSRLPIATAEKAKKNLRRIVRRVVTNQKRPALWKAKQRFNPKY